jgi:flagellar hook-length control protein FliK
MPVGANIRIAPVAGEAVAAAPAEAGGPAELFGQIISCLAVPSPEIEQPGVTAEAPAEQAETIIAVDAGSQGQSSPLATIQQLLSLGAGAAPQVQAAASAKPEDGEAQSPEDKVQEGLPAPLAPSSAPPALVQSPTAPVAAPNQTPIPNAAFSAEPAAQPIVQGATGDPLASSPIAVTTNVAGGQPKTKADLVSDDSLKPAQASQLAATPFVKDLGRTFVAPLSTKLELQPRSPDQPLPMMPTVAHLAASLLPRKLHPGSEATAAEPAAPAAVASPVAAPLPLAASGLLGEVPASARLELAPSEPALQVESSEIVVEHQLDLAHEGEWLDQLARDISQAAAGDGKTLRFRLNPETLGTLRVEISQDRQGAAIRLTADTEAARSVLADAQPRLLAEARAQGLRISEAHVDLGGQNASGDPRRQRAEFEEVPLRTARSLQEEAEGDGNPTQPKSERYA